MKNPKKRTRRLTAKNNPYRLTHARTGRIPFEPYVWANPEAGTVQIFLEDASHYGEWIKGEGADICIYRAIDDDRTIGACLPLRSFKGKLKSMMVPSMKQLNKAADDASERVSKMNSEQKAELLKEAKAIISSIPPWRKPPRDVPVQAFREFMARHGADVSVLVTWTHESNLYQFVTMGSDQLYSNSAVNLRDVITKALGTDSLGPVKEDLRGDHPNVRLNNKQLDFLLWLLGRAFGEKDKMMPGHQQYISEYHDQLLTVFGNSKDAIAAAPPA